ncbi:hypothetical protein Verru16b_00378 [Lacunisphaera limnophila]|uniref:Uncharacterized protein n=1 Tax=Lacunisphaera limnophila TaxID=1838286 RepID=A0A1D8AR21_9BACT|nr:hypothetical protein [Lacunisphaera limnophila]AOS43335.1 hypothetical protein Verru16b_00378 [Lacunisphaera limnophila]
MASPLLTAPSEFFAGGYRLRQDTLDAAFIVSRPANGGEEAAGGSGVGGGLPAGWQRLSTGLRGTRLYRVALPGRMSVYWEAAMRLGGKLLHRRFAGELHARAWLSASTEPRESGIPFDLEEIHGPLRTAGVKAGARAPR